MVENYTIIQRDDRSIILMFNNLALKESIDQPDFNRFTLAMRDTTPSEWVSEWVGGWVSEWVSGPIRYIKRYLSYI